MQAPLVAAKRQFQKQKPQGRIPVQMMDLKKHKLGEREIQIMIRGIGMENLLDREDKKGKEHPACYYDRESLLIPAIQEAPWLLKSPIVRNGNKVTVGYQPEVWEGWEK